jgi:hypothetical protein
MGAAERYGGRYMDGTGRVGGRNFRGWKDVRGVKLCLVGLV